MQQSLDAIDGHVELSSPASSITNAGGGDDNDGATAAVQPFDPVQPIECPTRIIPTAHELWIGLRDCSAVIGMHPDAATESIVDFALAVRSCPKSL